MDQMQTDEELRLAVGEDTDSVQIPDFFEQRGGHDGRWYYDLKPADRGPQPAVRAPLNSPLTAGVANTTVVRLLPQGITNWRPTNHLGRSLAEIAVPTPVER